MSDDLGLFDPRHCETVGELQEYLEQLPDNVPLKSKERGKYYDGVGVEIDNANLVLKMSDQQERCGHPTAGGEGPPCSNPATEGDHCWLEAHGGDTEPGRRSKFTEERAAEAKEAARIGMSKAGCARDLEGVVDGE